MKKFSLLICLLLSSFSSILASTIELKKVGDLQTREGLAGSFTGVIGGEIYVLGGSNFAKGFPWEGGVKQFYATVEKIQQKDGRYVASIQQILFPKKIAHGYAVSTGNTLLCFGGQTPEGDNQIVYQVSKINGEKLSIDSIASLPNGFMPYGAVGIGSDVFLIGAEQGAAATYVFRPQNRRWEKRCPYPGFPRQMAVVSRQNNGRGEMMYVFGGRCVREDAVDVRKDVLQYDPKADRWESKGEIFITRKVSGLQRNAISVMAAASIPVGTSNILIFGGDEGTEFLKRDVLERAIRTEKHAQRKDSLQSVLRALFTGHKGFSSHILSYHAVTNTWVDLADLPYTLPLACSAVKVNSDIVLVGGEIRPAVRQPDILLCRLSDKVSFGWLNYTVVIVYLLAMLGMGFYFMRRNKDTERFFKGGGNLPWWVVGVSIFATALSAITFLSIPAKAYATDWAMLVFNMMILFVAPVVIWFYLPFFRKLTVASAYEYLQTRFSASVRYVASAFFIVFMFARIAIVLYLPALALNAVTGLDVNLSILLMGVVTLIYCTMGGIEAVVWGDFVQGIILVGGALLSLIWMIADTEGGFGGFVNIALENNKFHTFDMVFDLSKPVFWVVLFGGFANQLLTYTSDQSVIQRYITTSDIQSARKSIWLNAILSVPVTFLFFLIGTGLFTYFKSHPYDINIGMQNADSIFPHFMMCRLPAGFAGLVIAAVFAAAMSTLSSNINSISTAFTEDFVRPLMRHASEKKRMRIARLSGLFAGSLGIGIALLLASSDIYSLWDQFNVFLGLFTSGLGGLFLMGIFSKRINARGALIGFFGSMLVLLLLRNFANVSFLLYGFIGLLSCFSIGYLCSWIPGLKNNKQ